MIVDLTDSITLIIIGACVVAGLIVACGLLGIAALVFALVAAGARAWRALRRRPTRPSWAHSRRNARNLARTRTSPSSSHTEPQPKEFT